MKITSFHTEIVEIPAADLVPIAARPEIRRPTVIVEIRTDEGPTGIGFTFLGAGLTRSLAAAIDALAGICIGRDPFAIGDIRLAAERAAGGAGPAGVFTLALAAIDIALWDIKGKALDLPLWQLLGAGDKVIPTYASGALMRDTPLDAVVEAAGRLTEMGFGEMKMQLALPGSTSPRVELDRARRVRECIGTERRLMCDINQLWRVDEAKAIAPLLEEIGFAWLEDLIGPGDFRAMARLAASLATPLTAGEYLYGLTPFRDMMEARAVDIVMIDPFRSGGITQWLKIAAMAEAFNLPVASHLAPELQLHLIAAIPNGLTVEYMPWSSRLFEDVPKPVDGHLQLPRAPGLGLSLDRKAIEHYRL